MATEYRILSIDTVKDTTHLYLIVEFYVKGQLRHVEDFIIGRSGNKRRYIGLIGPDDEPLELENPTKFVSEQTDIKQEIIDVIEGFARVHQKDLLTGKFTQRLSLVRTDKTDPNNFLARSEVKGMKGVKVVI